MNFHEKYELLNLIRDDGVKTFAARMRATRATLTVHVFPAEQLEANADLLVRVRTLMEAGNSVLVEFGELEGLLCVVTHTAPGVVRLREWAFLQPMDGSLPAPPSPDRFTRVGTWHVPAPPAVAPVPAPVAVQPPPVAGPGEFTRQFQAAAPPTPIGEPVAPAAPIAGPGEFTRKFQVSAPPSPPPNVAPVAAPAPAAGPGEFTRMFQAAAPPAPVTAPPAPVAAPIAARVAPLAPPTPAAGPGEFTRQFQAAGRPAPMGEAPAPPPLPAAPPSAPGEFTQFFRPAAAPPPATPVAPAGEFTQMFRTATPPPVAPVTPTGAGNESEFNRYFASPLGSNPSDAMLHPPAAPVVPPPPSSYAPAGEFTRMFGAGGLSATPPPQPMGMAPPAPAAVPPPAMPTGPGEYTRMFATPVAPSYAPPPVAVAPAPLAKAKGPNKTILIAVFATLFVLVVVAVLIFALKK